MGPLASTTRMRAARVLVNTAALPQPVQLTRRTVSVPRRRGSPSVNGLPHAGQRTGAGCAKCSRRISSCSMLNGVGVSRRRDPRRRARTTRRSSPRRRSVRRRSFTRRRSVRTGRVATRRSPRRRSASSRRPEGDRRSNNRRRSPRRRCSEGRSTNVLSAERVALLSRHKIALPALRASRVDVANLTGEAANAGFSDPSPIGRLSGSGRAAALSRASRE